MMLSMVVRDFVYTYNIGFASNLPQESTLRIDDEIYGVGLVVGFILWGLGFSWYMLAMSITIDHAIRDSVCLSPNSFCDWLVSVYFSHWRMGDSNRCISDRLDSPAFGVITAFLSVRVVMYWLYCGVMIVVQVWRGTLFTDPDLDKWDGRPPKRGGDVEKAG